MNSQEPTHKLKNPVFSISSLLIFALVGLTAAFPVPMNQYLDTIQKNLITHASWLYIFAVACIFLLVLYFGLSRYGDIRLGPDHSQPRYSYPSWFAMLFSAGMGIGIMFFGVGEPIMHFVSPPVGVGKNPAAAKEAMSIAFFHWGLHAWSVYALVGLILSYFCYRQKLPLTLRSAFLPLVGKRIWGPIGHTLDIFAIIGTIFGVAASLGYGVTQIGSGIQWLSGWSPTPVALAILILCVSILSTLSAVSGVEKGVRILSEFNLALAVCLMGMVLILGPTDFLLKSFLENTGNYLSGVIHKTFNLYAYEPNNWIGGWTLLYWSWWLSWSPFVGMFIARISYGRTIREFVLGVMIIPSLFNFTWMTVFGNSALYIALNEPESTLTQDVQNDIASSLFSFLSHFPLSNLTSCLALFMVLVFFITSADSGALVVNLLANKGREDNPVWEKVYWSALIGLVATVMFLVGGLQALQTITILSALPFSFILICSAFGLKKALNIDYLKRMSTGMNNITSPQIDNDNWKLRIENIMNTPKSSQILNFIQNNVVSSFKKVAEEFKKQGIHTKIRENELGAAFEVLHGEEIDFIYHVRIREYEPPSFAVNTHHKSPNRNYYRAEIFLKEGGQNYDVMGYSEDQIISDVLDQYEKHVHFLSMIR
ncbi:MAG: BCCT family transporter [Oligoflexales bacterium]